MSPLAEALATPSACPVQAHALMIARPQKMVELTSPGARTVDPALPDCWNEVRHCIACRGTFLIQGGGVSQRWVYGIAHPGDKTYTFANTLEGALAELVRDKLPPSAVSRYVYSDRDFLPLTAGELAWLCDARGGAMSPRIGSSLGLWPFAEAASALRPLDKARAAVGIVEGQGIRVQVGAEHNVGKHEVTHGWVIDRPQLRMVSLLGAICLALQPLDGDEVEDGAAAALECSTDWVAGLRDGWESDAQTTLLTGASRDLYLDGVRAGHLLFGEVTIECRECGGARYVRVATCACAA